MGNVDRISLYVLLGLLVWTCFVHLLRWVTMRFAIHATTTPGKLDDRTAAKMLAIADRLEALTAWAWRWVPRIALGRQPWDPPPRRGLVPKRRSTRVPVEPLPGAGSPSGPTASDAKEEP